MNTSNHISPDDLYLFALQLLPDADMKDAATHLKDCAQCRGLLGEIQGDLAAYALTAELHTPPAQARERLLRQVSEEKKVIPMPPPVEVPQLVEREPEHVEPFLQSRGSRVSHIDEQEERQPRRFAPIMAWVGWSIAAVMTAVAGMQVDQRKLTEQDLSVAQSQLNQSAAQIARAKQVSDTLRDASAMQVAMHIPVSAGSTPKLDPEGHATYEPSTGALVFVADHLDPLQADKTYQLWLLPATTGAAPIPAGLFKPDALGNATVVMPPLPKGVAARGFGVTVENEGGAKTPTLPVVLSGL